MKLTNEKLRQIIREEVNSLNSTPVNEGFATWEIEFGKGKVSGTDYAAAGKISVKARTTVEAIKKAVAQVGNKEDWVAVHVQTLIKK